MKEATREETKRQSHSRVVVIGAGGHAAALDEYIGLANQHAGRERMEVLGFLDDDESSHARYEFSAPWLGSIEGHLIADDASYIIAIAEPAVRRRIAESLLEQGARFQTFVHPGAFVSRSAHIGKGVVIAPNVTVGPNVVVGDFCFLNARSSLGHDTVLGSFNTVCPNAAFSGFTKVGDENLFGLNSATAPSIKVGSRCKIAPGMVLDRDVDDESTVFYRYKEKVVAVRGW